MLTNNKGNYNAIQPAQPPQPPRKKGNAAPATGDGGSGTGGQSEFQFGTAEDAQRAGQKQLPVGGEYRLLFWYPPGMRVTGKALHLRTNRQVEITLIPFAEIAGSREEGTGRFDLWGSREWGIRTAVQHDGLEPLRDCGRCEVHRCHYTVTDTPDGVPLSALPLPVPVPMAVSVMLAVVPALAELHAGDAAGRPVVHGGVGLDSILVIQSPAPRIVLSGFSNMTYAGEMRPDGTGPASPADDILAVGKVFETLLFSGPPAPGVRAPARASLVRYRNLLTGMLAPVAKDRPPAERVLARLMQSPE